MKLIKRGVDIGQADANFKVEHFRNAFLNLAVPSLMMSEVAKPIEQQIRDDLIVNDWSRWEIAIKESTTLGQIVKALEKKFRL